MTPAAGIRRLGRLSKRKVLVATLVLEVMIILQVIVVEQSYRRGDLGRLSYKMNPWSWWRDNDYGPTVRPATVRAAAANLRPQDWIIGVVVNGKARAYRVDAFDDASGHVVNDLIAGVPVSVAYSNLSRCVRVYTGAEGSGVLDAEVTGLLNQQMVIKLAGHHYFHDTNMPVEPASDSSAIPYRTLTPTVTIWKAWTQLHPDTDVFMGGR